MRRAAITAVLAVAGLGVMSYLGNTVMAPSTTVSSTSAVSVQTPEPYNSRTNFQDLPDPFPVGGGDGTAQSAAKKGTTAKDPVILLHPVDDFYGQETIDKGKVVTYLNQPTCLLVGHANKGWQNLGSLPQNKEVLITSGSCAGRYKVLSNKTEQNTGIMPSWMNTPKNNFDAVLMSTNGSINATYSLLKKQGA